jgi:iron complex transport system permease protein
MSEILTSRRFFGYLAWLTIATAAVLVICVCLGPAGFFVLSAESLQARLLRVLTAALVGAALSAAGVTFQALLRNPLASPSILGVSSGASAGLIFVLFLQQQPLPRADLADMPPPVMALIFALVTIGLVYWLSVRRGHLDPLSLLLVGVMVSAFNGALVMIMNLMVPHGLRADIVVWMMGKIGDTVRWGQLDDWTVLGSAAAVIGAGILALMSMTRQFNLQALGEQTARSLGVRVEFVRLASFLAASVITAVAVSISGPIAFVGLICPHVCRMIFGSDHRVLMIASIAFGAMFLASADTAVRTLANITAGEIPVGVVTALCGGPFFIYLLRRKFSETPL